MFKGITKRCKHIIEHFGAFEANRYNHDVVQPEHILIAILKEGQSNAYTVLNDVIDLIHFQFILESHIGKIPNGNPADNVDILKSNNIDIEISMSDRTNLALEIAVEEAKKNFATQVDTFALLLACCEEEGSVAKAIIMRHELVLDDLREKYYEYVRTQKGVTPTNVEKTMEKKGESDNQHLDNNHYLSEVRNVQFHKLINNLNNRGLSSDYSSSLQNNSDSSNISSLDKDLNLKVEDEKLDYLVNMNKLVLEKKTTSIFGREKELQQIYRILLRKQKNNPVLVGDPGVGKSAIVEELVLRTVNGNAPLPLLNTIVYQLNVAALTAGTRYRGDFEERLLKVINFLKTKKSKGVNPILFIDEFHHIMGAGLANGLSMDAAGILKPALARGELSCLGITTSDEYRKHIEADKAFLRRLQKLDISEMTEEDTYLTLQKVKDEYEKKHNVEYSNESLKEIIRLSKSYIFDRKFPDKAVDLLDEIGAHKSMILSDTPKELSLLYKREIQLNNDIKELTNEIGVMTIDTHLQKADELKSIVERKTHLHSCLLKNISHQKSSVTPDNVSEVISFMTGIPSDRLDDDGTRSIKVLEKGLRKNIVGQEVAISSLISAIKRSLVGLHRGNRPIGSFMFLGPTGVGKTYTAKQLALHLFGSDEMVTRFDMSDFSESNSINRLIGSPPGYVGYEESGLLVKLTRRNPRQLLLFDEIEKAHPRIFDMFLQILEEGKLQGQVGEVADFRHSIIVMTSNIGSKELLEKKKFGFSDQVYSSDYVKNIVHEELSNHFRPELINRFDEIITFNPLGKKEISDVIEHMVNDLIHALSEQNIQLKVKTNTKKLLHDIFYDVEFGARSIRRGIRSIENVIAETIIDKEVESGDNLVISTKDDKFLVKKQTISKRDSNINLKSTDENGEGSHKQSVPA